MLLPVASSQLCGQQRGYDMAFELLTNPPWIKWDQPFKGIRDWPHYEDVESQGISTLQQENIGRVVADDWFCESSTPVVAAAWWGSYIGYGHACQ
jgi:ABC-type lipopolysaccharide export system ATPase subunit